jgi:hypothetical protein
MKGGVKIIEKKLHSFSSCILMCQRIKKGFIVGFWEEQKIILLFYSFKNSGENCVVGFRRKTKHICD